MQEKTIQMCGDMLHSVCTFKSNRKLGIILYLSVMKKVLNVVKRVLTEVGRSEMMKMGYDLEN